MGFDYVEDCLGPVDDIENQEDAETLLEGIEQYTAELRERIRELAEGEDEE